MQTLTYSSFIAILAAHSGALPVGILALTDSRARKTGNPFPDKTIMKLSRSVGFVGAKYENAVHREGERQGERDAHYFVAEKLPWGKWLIPNKVIEKEGAYYLRTQSTPGQRNRQPARVLSYRDIHGRTLDRDAVKPFLPLPSFSTKQAAYGLGDGAAAERAQVQVRTYAFDSIEVVRVAGATYRLVRD